MLKSKTVAEIESLLRRAFAPEHLEVTDDSARHAGHDGAKEHGGGHFTVTIVSTKFIDLLPLGRHRLIHEALASLYKDHIHALSIDAKTPQEWFGQRTPH